MARKKYIYRYEVNQVTGRREKLKIRIYETARKKTSKRKCLNKTREKVIKRDKGKCVECGCRYRLNVHHIKPVSQGGTNDIDNLVTLCDLCHMEKHRGEAIYNLMIKNFWIYEDIG